MKKESGALSAHNSAGWGFLCRQGFEGELRREICQRLAAGKKGETAFNCEQEQKGLVLLRGGLSANHAQMLARPLVFERQRLPRARYFPLAGFGAAQRPGALGAAQRPGALGAEQRPGALGAEQRLSAAALASYAVGELRRAGAGWTMQSYAFSPNAPNSLTGWARRTGDEVRRALEAMAPALKTQYREGAAALPPARGRVLQLCAVPGGAWVALNAPNALSNAQPGGVPDLTADPLAPSRSFLKIEEALQMLGVVPAPRERVIDLGAAPGGWSYAFLLRGCSVLAVDNGPLKLKGVQSLAGELKHVRANGLTFRPPAGWAPVDWMVSDMLVAPGPTQGLLRRWLNAGWAKRYIVNIKLPQREPLAALQPLLEMLADMPGLTCQLRQLYHDRREVTLMGQMALDALGHGAAGERPGRKTEHAWRGAKTERKRSRP